MKPIGFMNGWLKAPGCWKTFLFRPIHIDRTPNWWSLRVFGFVVFFSRSCP